MAFATTSFSETSFASDGSSVIAYAQGSSLTTSLGNSTIVANSNVNVTGSQSTITTSGIDVVGASSNVSVTGSQLTSSIGEETVNIGVDITGLELSISNKKFTKDTLKTFAQAPFASQVLSNVEVAIVIVDATTGVDVTGILLQPTLGTFSISADGNVSVVVTEHTLNTSIGSEGVTANTDVSVTGTQMATSLGGETIDINTPVDVSGIQMTGSLGDVIPTDFAVVSVTGIELQSSVGSPNITAWAEINPGVNNVWTEINPGVNNVWTEVDLAA